MFVLAYIVCIVSLWSFIPLLASLHFRFPSASIDLLSTLGVLISDALKTPMGHVADRQSRKALSIAGGLLIIASMFILVFAEKSWHLCMTSISIGLDGGIAVPSIMAIAVVAGRAAGGMASMMALFVIAHSLGMIAGPVLVGAVIDQLNLRVGFLACALLICLALVFSVYAIFGKGQIPKMQTPEHFRQ